MTLKLYPFARNEAEALNAKSDVVEQNIIADQYHFFLDSSGLAPFLETLYSREQDVRNLLTYSSPSLFYPGTHNFQWKI